MLAVKAESLGFAEREIDLLAKGLRGGNWHDPEVEGRPFEITFAPIQVVRINPPDV